MKPKIHLNGSLGLLMFGVGFMPMIMIGILIYEKYFSYYDDALYQPYLSWEMIFTFCVAGGFVLSGIGLILRIKRAYFLASISILFGALLMARIVYEEFRFKSVGSDDFWVELGVTVLVFVMLFFGLLFIGNDKVGNDFKELDEEDWSDILDVQEY